MTNASAAVRGFGPVFVLLFALQFISMGAMEMSGPFWPIQIKALSASDSVFGFAGVGVYVGPMIGMSLIGLPLFAAIIVFAFAMIMVAVIKTNSGEKFRYPLIIRFIK
jgi:uncharacterized membrane protein